VYRTCDFFHPARKNPAHSAAKNRQFLTQNQVAILNHTPYSADNSSRLLPFPKVMLQLNGARFGTIEEIQKSVSDQLNKITPEEYCSGLRILENYE
jgi:hypothetical protein